MSAMEILRGCNIIFEDEIHDEIDGGLVIITGDKGNAIATISEFRKRKRKYERVDQLTKATFVNIGTTWRITGTSGYLSKTVRDPNSTMTIEVTPTPCKDCNK
jgi:hypothetical protein